MSRSERPLIAWWGNMDLINGIEDRVQRAKAKSALVKAKRNI